jgi:glucosyl-dolichyl phosphate glucuronosyltransferase
VQISVVVCTHRLDNYPNLRETIESLLNQSHPDKNIVVVIDGNPALFNRVQSDYRTIPSIQPLLLKENAGVSAARSAGTREATGEVIAFIDDDATAAPDWLQQLIAAYEEFDALAVGGKILPVWAAKRPDYLPEELDWLIGVTDAGFTGDRLSEVRNTYGPNMSFKKQVFLTVGYFNQSLGFTGNAYVQGEEPEIALRMKQKFHRGMIYKPQAVVYHKIHPAKLKINVLLKRSFFQGYSKALLRRITAFTDSTDVENAYLRYLLLDRLPHRLIRIYRLAELKKVAMLSTVILFVAAGFVYGYFKAGRHSAGTTPTGQ